MADALLVLIPMKDKPKTSKEFRPINLCYVSFKLVIKVLVNKLKTMLKEIMSPNQSSFFPHYHIISNIICYEMIDTLKHKTGSREGDDCEDGFREGV